MDNISVAIRVRPLINREKGAAAKIHWKTETDSITQIDADGKPKGKCYNFDRVYDVTETTADVYEEVAQPIVQAAMQGYDGTIFAYGQTSSGKTFTMQGNGDTPGIIPLTVEEIFKTIQETPEREFLLRVYYVELYNECLMDLLVSNENKELRIREVEMTLNGETKYRVTLTNQEEVVCTKVSEILALIKKGDLNRHVGRTNMNEHSSRSHSIFCIIIESRKRTEKRESGDGCVMMSHLYLVDLAGSERADETKARGQRLKEACKINQSLSSLSNVIQKLSRGESYIPFRDSKLTRLLQSSLGGNAKTAIICAVTPAAIDQTHGTLQFASRAKEIKNTATVNEIVSDEAMMQRLKKELQNMKAKIDALQKGGMEELQTERDDLARSLDAKSEMIRAHEEKIRYLSSVVLVSSNVNEPGPTKNKKKKLRRETWCPGSMKVGSPITKAIASAGLDFSSMAPLLPFPQLPKAPLNLANANHDFGTRHTSVPEAQVSPTSTSRECVEATSSVDDFPTFPTEGNDSVFSNSMVTSRHDFSGEEKMSRKRRTVRFADTVQEETTDFQVHDLQSQLQETMSMCEGLLDEKNTLEALIDDKDEQYRQLQYELDVLKVDCDIKDDDQSEDMMTLQQELQNKQKLIDHLEIDVKKYEKELSELKDFTKLEFGTIQEQEEEYKAEIQSLHQSLQERDTNISEMNSTLDQMRQVQELSFENRSLADAELMVMDLRKKLSEVTDNNKLMTQQIEIMQSDIKKLNQEKGDFDLHILHEKEVTDNNTLMTQQMEIMQSDIKKLNQEKGDFDSHILFEKERHQRMCTDLKDQLQKAYDENTTLSAATSNCVDTQNAVGISKAVECSAETEMLKAELEQFKTTIQELNDEKAQLQSDLELSIDSNIEAQQQFMEVQEDLEQKATLIKQLQDQLVNSNTELAENSGRVEDLHEIIEKLERELETIRSQQDPDKHIRELQVNIKENDCTIEDLKHKLEMSQTTNTCSVELEKRIEEVENSNVNKDSVICDLKQELETLQICKVYSEELQGRVKELENEVLEWSDRCVKIEDELEVKVAYLEKQLAEQRHNSTSHDMSLDPDKHIRELQVNIKENDCTIEDLKHKLEMSLDPDKHIRELQVNIKENDCTIEDLKHKLEMSQTTNTCSVELEKRIEEVENSNVNKDSVICDLKQELETLQMGKVYSEELQGRVKELENEVLEWSDRCVKIEDELEVKVAYLEKQLAEQRHNSTSHDMSLSTAEITQQEVEILTELNMELESKVTELNQQLETSTNAIGNNSQEHVITDLQSQLSVAKNYQLVAEQLEEKISNLTKEYQMKVIEVNKLSEELDSANEKRVTSSHLQVQVRELENCLAEANSEANQFKSIVEELSKQLELANETKACNSVLQVKIEDLEMQLSGTINFKLLAEQNAKKVDDLTKQLHSIKRQSVDDTDWLQIQVTELEKMLRESNMYKSVAEDLKINVIDLETRLAEAGDYQTTAKQLEQRVALLTEKLDMESKSDVENMSQVQITDLEQQLIEARGYQIQVAELEKQLRESNVYKSVAEDLKINVIDLETRLAEAGDYQTTAKQLEQRVALLTEKLDMESKSDEENRSQVQITDLEQQLIEARGYQIQVAELEKQLRESNMYKSVAEDLKLNVIDLETRLAEAGDYQTTAKQLEQRVALLTEKLDMESKSDAENRSQVQITDLEQKLIEARGYQIQVAELEKQLRESSMYTSVAEDLKINVIDLETRLAEAGDYQTTSKQLEQRVALLTEKLDMESKSDEENRSQVQITDLEQQLIEARGYQIQVAELEKQLRESNMYKSVAEDLKINVIDLESRLAEAGDYQTTAKQLEQRVALLTEKLDMESKSDAENRSQVQITDLEQKLIEARGYQIQVAELEKQLRESSMYTSVAEDLKINVIDLETRLAEAGDYQTTSKQLEQRVALLTEKLDMESKSDEENRSQVQITDLEQQLIEARGYQIQVAELEKQLRESNMYKSVAEDLKINVIDLESRLAEAGDYQTTAKQLEQRVALLTEKLDMESKSDEENRSQVQITDLEQQLIEARCYQIQVAKLEKQLRESSMYKSVAEDLKMNVVDLETRLAEAGDYQTTAKQLEQRVALLTEKLDMESKSDEENRSQVQITDLEQQLIEARGYQIQVAELEKQLRESSMYKSVAEDLKMNVVDLETRLAEAGDYQTTAKQLEQRVALLTEKLDIESKSDEENRSQVQITDLEQQLIEARGYQIQVAELEKQLRESNMYKSVAEDLKINVIDLESRLAEAGDYQTTAKQLEQRVALLTEKLDMESKSDAENRSQVQITDLEQQLIEARGYQIQVAELEKQLRESNMYKSVAEDLKINVIDLESRLAEAGDYQTTAKQLEQRVALLTEKLDMESKSDEENRSQVQITGLEQQLIEAKVYQTKAQDLRQKVDELKTHIQAAEIEHEQVIATMKDANKLNLQEMESLTTHIEKNKQYKENIACLELAEAQHTRRIQALEKQLIEYNTGTCEAEELRVKIKELMEQVCIAESEIQRITEELTLAKQRNEEIVSLQTRVASMEQQITKGKAYLVQLLDEKKEAQQASEENEAYIGEIEQELEENKEELQTLTQTCEEKLGQVLELEQQLADMHDDKSQLIEELNTAKQSVDEEISKTNQLESIKAEHSELLEQLNVAKVMCLEKENLATELSEKLANVRTNETRLAEELNSVKQCSTEAESLHIQIAELQKESSKIRKQLSKTETLLSIAQQKCEDKDWLEIEVTELKKRIPESECVQLELKEAKCAIEAYQKRVDVLSKELNDVKQHERTNNENAEKREMDLYEQRLKEERNLQNIIEEVDEELSTEKKQHKETIEKLEKLKNSFEALKSAPTPLDIKVLEKKIAEQDIKIVGYEYDLRMVKDDRDQRVSNFIKDAEYYNSHIKRLQAQIDELKEKESCASKPAAEATTATRHPVIGNTSSSGVILEHELFSLKHQKEKLTKANAKLEKENISTGIRCAALEDKMIKTERDMKHYKDQAKIFYSKYHSVIDSNSKQASTSSEPVARALQDINETGVERSPLRQQTHEPAEYYTEQIPGWQPPQQATTKEGAFEWPHCEPKDEEEPAECKPS